MVIPSFLRARNIEDLAPYMGEAFSNGLLRIGEVQKVIYPEDADSISKKFVEYNVLVQHRENNTAVTLLYQNCLLFNPLAGFADQASWTLRADPAHGPTQDSQGGPVDGKGSKVLLLCVNGERGSAFVMGGVRDTADTDIGRRDLGHHLRFVFNGVGVDIRDDGSFQVTMAGATNADGTPNGKTSGPGTAVEIKADGTAEIRTPGGAQKITINHATSEIRIDAEQQLTLTADRISVGDSATEPMVLGQTLVRLLTQLCTQLETLTVVTAVGTSSPPVNGPAIAAISAELTTALSQLAFVKATR